MDFRKTSVVITLPFLLLNLINPIQAQNFHKDFLNGQNVARAQEGVMPLVSNDTVASYAENYANKRATDCELVYCIGPYGENITGGRIAFSGSNAVKMWVLKKQFYDYESNSCVGDECLHYTQVVWRDSIHLGCARAKSANGWWFITCNYDPQGQY